MRAMVKQYGGASGFELADVKAAFEKFTGGLALPKGRDEKLRAVSE